jgi:hypothetical protein
MAIKYTDNDYFSQVIISPKSDSKIEWSLIDITKQELLKQFEYLKNTMISVATGGQRIQNVEQQYKGIYLHINSILRKLDIDNPNIYDNLWSWYEKWRTDFPRYQERRNFINEMYNPLINMFYEVEDSKIVDIKLDLSDWDEINRTILKLISEKSRHKPKNNFKQ